MKKINLRELYPDVYVLNTKRKRKTRWQYGDYR